MVFPFSWRNRETLSIPDRLHEGGLVLHLVYESTRPNTPLLRPPFSCHQFCVRKIVASFRGR